MLLVELYQVELEEIDEDAWTVSGEPITLTQLLELAHPGVLDPGIAYERYVAAPSAKELERWTRALGKPAAAA